MAGRGVVRTSSALGAALAVVLAATASAGPPEQASDAFRGETDVALGEKFHAAFPATAAGPHRFTFYAVIGTVVSGAAKRDDGASLVPRLRLTTPGGEKVAGSAYRNTGAKSQLLDFRVRYSGFYVLEVSAKSGSGGYSLATKRKEGTKYYGHYDSPPDRPSFQFFGPRGAKADVRVAPEKKGPEIEITGLRKSDGADIPFLSIQDGDAAEVLGIPLTESGAHSVEWTNLGEPGPVKLTFKFRYAEPPVGVRELGTAEGVAGTTIETGDPDGPPRDGYAGSNACGECHTEILNSWSRTAHNSAVRTWNRAGLSNLLFVNDANANGTDDFHDGLDLATTPAFAAYGANAPKLSFDASSPTPYRVTIGTLTYVVERTMGGNGLWAQRYLTRIGNGWYPLPFQFAEAGRKYTEFEPGDWYDAAHVPKGIGASNADPDRSFEAQCSGCHNTGELLSAAGSGGYSTGYVEMNIGCEQCHGPGGEHAATGDTRKIKNPANLLDHTAAGVVAANEICGRCHDKGKSVDPLPGSAAKAGFGFLAARGVSQAGDKPSDFVNVTKDTAEFWGLKLNPLPSVPGDTSVAARGYPLQNNDLELGTHAPHAGFVPNCFSCHDPHSNENAHQIRTLVDDGVPVVTRTEDNSLCLACHAGIAPFGDTTKRDAALISSGTTPESVKTSVTNHMKDVGMPVTTAQYDPAGTGVGRCSMCHMPLTATVGGPVPDKAGWQQGDFHSHRFRPVWPRASELYGVTNSCSVCHPTQPGDPVATIISQWAKPPATASQTAFHGATPPISQFNVPLNDHLDTSAAGGMQCIACHTADGFKRILVEGAPVLQGAIDDIAKQAIAEDRGLTCDACHGKRADGLFYGTDRNPLRIEKAQLCSTCHNDRDVDFDAFRLRGVVVRHPQREMLAGDAGSAPPGIPDVAATYHTSFQDGCVTCHFDPAVASHDFTPKVATCTSCHPGLNTFNRPAKADYDGDSFVEGVQDEVKGLLFVLREALLADPQMSFAGGFFDYAGGTDHALTGASDAQKRSVFNWYSVSDDRSFGVHNTARAVQLLQASYRELTGNNVPGAILR